MSKCSNCDKEFAPWVPEYCPDCWIKWGIARWYRQPGLLSIIGIFLLIAGIFSLKLGASNDSWIGVPLLIINMLGSYAIYKRVNGLLYGTETKLTPLRVIWSLIFILCWILILLFFRGIYGDSPY